MPALDIVILPSLRFAALLWLLHLAAAALVALLPIPLWPKAASLAAMAWSLRRCLDEIALLRAPEAIVVVKITRDSNVFARSRTDTWLECDLLPSSFVSYRLTILNLKTGGNRRPHHVVLCCGNVNAAELRRLRVWLRWAALKAVGRSPIQQ